MPEVRVKLGFQGGVKRGQMDGEERKSVAVRENGLGGLGRKREKGKVNKLLLHTCRILGISHSLISRSQGSIPPVHTPRAPPHPKSDPRTLSGRGDPSQHRSSSRHGRKLSSP